jgi:hypothetical protein
MAKLPGLGEYAVLRVIRPPGVLPLPEVPRLFSTVCAPPCSHSPSSGPLFRPHFRRDASRSAALIRLPADLP